MKVSFQYKERTKRDYIYNICHFNNVLSILENGLFSFNDAKRIKHTSIATPEIQEHRDVKTVKVPNGLLLHQYANCFFNPRNSMLYSKQNEFNNIAILCISIEVLDFDNTVVSDKNAANNTVAFYSAKIGIPILNFKEIFISNWNSPDPFEKERLKPILHAEVLVPHKIDSRYIMEIKVIDNDAKQKLYSMIGNKVKISVDRYLFFR